MKLSHRPDLDIVGLDFETYYDKDYSLRKQHLSTSTYVRNPLFRTQSVAVRLPGQRKARGYPGKDVPKVLADIDWDRTALLAHHAQFDGLILTHHYGVTPRYYCCTLSMARALHGNAISSDLDTVARFYNRGNKLPDVLPLTRGVRELPRALEKQLIEYNKVDVDIMWGVFKDMLAMGYPPDELDLIDLTVSLFTEPVLEADRELAESERLRAIHEANAAFRKVKVERKQLTSRDRFAELLREAGTEPPVKPKKPTPKNPNPEGETWAFAKDDLDFIALKAHPTRRVRDLVAARLLAQSNINETRARGVLERTANGMRLPIYLNYCGAHTMRFSGGDKLNPQNFPAEGRKLKSKLRRTLRAPKGHVIVVVDSGQIEARYSAWFCDQHSLLETFADPTRCAYCEFATELYNEPITKEGAKKSNDMFLKRFVGKTCTLGLTYQMSAPRLQHTLASGAMGPEVWLELDVCEAAVHKYRQKNRAIVGMWKKLQGLVHSCLLLGHEFEHKGLLFRKEEIVMPNGLSLHYPNLRMHTPEGSSFVEYRYKQQWRDAQKLYGGLTLENVTQCLSRIDICEAILELMRHFRIISMSHDEIIYLARENEADEALQLGLDLVSRSKSWAPEVPLTAEGGYDVVYSK